VTVTGLGLKDAAEEKGPIPLGARALESRIELIELRRTRALPEKNESGRIPLRARIRFKNRTGRQASTRWGSRIQRICVSA
jgi:hypothetical protein